MVMGGGGRFYKVGFLVANYITVSITVMSAREMPCLQGNLGLSHLVIAFQSPFEGWCNEIYYVLKVRQRRETGVPSVEVGRLRITGLLLDVLVGDSLR